MRQARLTVLWCVTLIAACAGVRAQTPPAAATTLVKDVVKRLTAVVEAPAGMTWPPAWELKTGTQEVNAMAWLEVKTAGPPQPRMLVTAALLERVVEEEPDRLAFVMGHELAHITLGHVQPGERGKTPLLKFAFSRDQELAADRKGMEYALAAGYSFRRALRGIQKLSELGPTVSSLEGLRSDHPSWKDRLAYIDQEQQQLWRAMSAFETGNSFLALEQYTAAIRCFHLVTRDFPECHEGWTNLGFSALMQFCDALDAKDLQKFEVGQIACAGFYRRPESLASKVRGIDEEAWNSAVTAFRQALRLRPELYLPKAHLGIAYLISPAGKDPVKAAAYLREALEGIGKDPEASASLKATILINLAVAEMGQKSLEPAAQRLNEAGTILQSGPGTKLTDGGGLGEALSYNQALIETLANDPAMRRSAAGRFLNYLKGSSRSSAWWSTAYQQYARLTRDLGAEPATEAALRPVKSDKLRPVVSLELAGGKRIVLAEPTAELTRQLGPGARVPISPNSSISRIQYSPHKLEVLAGDQVLAIFLSDPAGPPVWLRSTGLTGKKLALRPGMSQDELEGALADIEYDFRQLVDPQTNYRFYRQLGLAIRLKGGVVQEIVIAQVPDRPIIGG